MKLSLRNEGEIKTLWNEEKLRILFVFYPQTYPKIMTKKSSQNRKEMIKEGNLKYGEEKNNEKMMDLMVPRCLEWLTTLPAAPSTLECLSAHYYSVGISPVTRPYKLFLITTAPHPLRSWAFYRPIGPMYTVREIMKIFRTLTAQRCLTLTQINKKSPNLPSKSHYIRQGPNSLEAHIPSLVLWEIKDLAIPAPTPPAFFHVPYKASHPMTLCTYRLQVVPTPANNKKQSILALVMVKLLTSLAKFNQTKHWK